MSHLGMEHLGMKNSFVVFGNPIEQSKSPSIHQQFANQFSIQLNYQRQWAEVGDFENAANHFFQQEDSKGANVTAPFKLDAFNYSSQLTNRAQIAGAVNTLTKVQTEQGLAIQGDNTDGIGWVRDICNNQQQSLTNKRILVWGAGGAARGLLNSIIEQQPASITVVNRTHQNALSLVEKFNQNNSAVEIIALQLDAISDMSFDFIINTTSISLEKINSIDLPLSLAESKPFCYDLMYSATKTVFTQWAENLQLLNSDGLGMLVEQAAESFYIWYNLRPETQPVIDFVRKQLLQKL